MNNNVIIVLVSICVILILFYLLQRGKNTPNSDNSLVETFTSITNTIKPKDYGYYNLNRYNSLDIRDGIDQQNRITLADNITTGGIKPCLDACSNNAMCQSVSYNENDSNNEKCKLFTETYNGNLIGVVQEDIDNFAKRDRTPNIFNKNIRFLVSRGEVDEVLTQINNLSPLVDSTENYNLTTYNTRMGNMFDLLQRRLDLLDDNKFTQDELQGKARLEYVYYMFENIYAKLAREMINDSTLKIENSIMGFTGNQIEQLNPSQDNKIYDIYSIVLLLLKLRGHIKSDRFLEKFNSKYITYLFYSYKRAWKVWGEYINQKFLTDWEKSKLKDFLYNQENKTSVGEGLYKLFILSLKPELTPIPDGHSLELNVFSENGNGNSRINIIPPDFPNRKYVFYSENDYPDYIELCKTKINPDNCNLLDQCVYNENLRQCIPKTVINSCYQLGNESDCNNASSSNQNANNNADENGLNSLTNNIDCEWNTDLNRCEYKKCIENDKCKD